MIKKILRIFIIYLIFIITINSIIFSAIIFDIEPISRIYNDGIIIRIKPLNYALIFAHGSENFLKEDNMITELVHTTTLKEKSYKTKDVLDSLKYEGYDKVWISMCETGNSKYMQEIPNGTKIMWYDWVSRNKKYGYTLPIFNGVWFTRVTLSENSKIYRFMLWAGL